MAIITRYNQYPSGAYETDYGNICVFHYSDDCAYDLDMGKKIPLSMVNWQKRIGDADDFE
jgi:hypothetical protein